MRDDNRPQRNPGRNPFEGNDSPPLVDAVRKIIEIACLCGARETDEGQERPAKCWSGGKEDGMGLFDTGRIRSGG